MSHKMPTMNLVQEVVSITENNQRSHILNFITVLIKLKINILNNLCRN